MKSMTSLSPSREQRERGQALVESALVLTVLLATIIGIFDVGQMFFVHQGITERVRAASRYGAVKYTDLNAIRNVVLYNQPTMPVSSIDGQAPATFMNLNPSNIVVNRYAANTSDDRIEIKVVNYQYQLFSPWVAGYRYMRPIQTSTPVETP